MSVLLAPARVPEGCAAVVVDVLRATTTLAMALAHGAARVVPAASPAEAHALRAREPRALLCGERGGWILPGFDLGNSPAEYTRAVVAGRTLVFASTNGSRALILAAAARRRLIGAFVNGTAAVDSLEREPVVVVLCAGALGHFCLEDAACAGWLCVQLAARGARIVGTAARFASSLAPQSPAEVRALVQGSADGRTLRNLGFAFARDVEWCAELDRIDCAFEV